MDLSVNFTYKESHAPGQILTGRKQMAKKAKKAKKAAKPAAAKAAAVAKP